MPYYKVTPEINAYYDKLVPFQKGRNPYNVIQEHLGDTVDIDIPGWKNTGSKVMERMCENMEDGKYIRLCIEVSHRQSTIIEAEDEGYALESPIKAPEYPQKIDDGWNFCVADSIEISPDVKSATEEEYWESQKNAELTAGPLKL